MTTCPKCGLSWGRSAAEHNTLFGVIDFAFDSWPDGHGFQPPTPEHLRGWLAIKVGHSRIVRIPRARGLNRDGLQRIAEIFTGGKVYYEAEATKSEIEITIPETMKKSELKVQVFRQMASKVYDLIEAITGITPDIYKQNKDKVA